MTDFFNSTVGMSYGWAWFVATIVGILVIALPLMLAVAMIIYADRKIWAAMALRRGPNVVGPFGLLQSFADGLKVFLQETIIPSAANRALFLIAPIITFTDTDDMIRQANDTELGLTGYVYTRDLAKGLRVSEQIQAGMIGLNRGAVSDPAAPLGGMKQSGLGHEGSTEGIYEFCETQYIATNW